MSQKSSIPSNIRWDTWLKFNNRNFDGKCFCCDCDISVMNFHVGHIKSVKNGGTDHINNLQPICAQCNGSGGMGTRHMYEYMNTYGKKRHKKFITRRQSFLFDPIN